MSIKHRLDKLETQKKGSGGLVDRLGAAFARARAPDGSIRKPLYTREELEADLAKYPPDSMKARLARALLRVEYSDCYEKSGEGLEAKQ
jgi:hypothetical protein